MGDYHIIATKKQQLNNMATWTNTGTLTFTVGGYIPFLSKKFETLEFFIFSFFCLENYLVNYT